MTPDPDFNGTQLFDGE